MTNLVLMQSNPFLTLAEINEPVAEKFQDCKQVVASNQDDDSSVGKGVGSEPVIPLREFFTILLA
jgi:hypothetical protein